jgi:hypothetical protein
MQCRPMYIRMGKYLAPRLDSPETISRLRGFSPHLPTPPLNPIITYSRINKNLE